MKRNSFQVYSDLGNAVLAYGNAIRKGKEEEGFSSNKELTEVLTLMGEMFTRLCNMEEELNRMERG